MHLNIKFLTVAICALFLVACFGKRPKTITGLEGKQMPDIALLAIDSVTSFNTREIQKGKPTVLFSFEGWCPYCKAQTKEMLADEELLQQVNLYMIANGQFSHFREFYEQFQLNRFSQIKAGVDQEMIFMNYFKSPGVPYFAVYDSNKKLKQVLIGKTDVSVIKRISLQQ